MHLSGWGHIENKVNPHFRRAVLRCSHPGPGFQTVAKLLVDVEAGVRRGSCWTHTHQHQCTTIVRGHKYSQSVLRSLTQREDLPQQYAVRPNIALGGEHLVEDGLGRHPLQRETGLRANQSTGSLQGFTTWREVCVGSNPRNI